MQGYRIALQAAATAKEGKYDTLKTWLGHNSGVDLNTEVVFNKDYY